MLATDSVQNGFFLGLLFSGSFGRGGSADSRHGAQQPALASLWLPPRTTLSSGFTKIQGLGVRSFRRTAIFRSLFIAKLGNAPLKVIIQMWHMFCCEFSVELFPVIFKINETLHSTFSVFNIAFLALQPRLPFKGMCMRLCNRSIPDTQSN